MALGKRRKEEEESAIDMTPMLDVVFIMLIFFIVTASFVNESGLSVSRPPTSDQPPPDSKNTNIVFRVSESNELTLEGRRIDIRAVRANVERMHAEKPEAKVIIDFTSPMATVEHSELAAQARVAHIIGTTGMNLKDLEQIKMAARHAPIVRAGNMSLGVNLLMELTQKISAALDEDFDIEIIESHHRAKVDAPSGTALMLGQAAALGRGISLETESERGRDGITGERGKGKIGFSSIRGGDGVGEHDVVFAADGERIVLRHIASDRAIFARGALKAALWALGKPPGEYSMLNVLGLD